MPAMLESMAHRGPDGRGTWSAPSGACVLGHRRLAVIDPEGGSQPLSNEDGSVWISYNGCIYNYEEIARDLRGRGHTFRTKSDTEVIVHAWEEWGAGCVERFNGMWAFALWDSRRRLLFCSRDRVGIKPFYYHFDSRRFIFASEIKAILATGEVTPRPDETGLRQYLSFQLCLDDRTLFEGIRRLRPGHNLLLPPGGEPEISRYWDISFEIDENHTEKYFTQRLAELAEDAVRLRLRSDVPLGAHLSGGLDSSSVVMLARRHLGPAKLKTFTGAFDEGRAFDESAYARTTAREAQAEYLETRMTAGDFERAAAEITWHMDEPAAGPGVFPQYFVSKLASENVKVALGGQGGDEIFLGYARYLVAYLEECLKGAIHDTAHRNRYVATLETIVPSLAGLEQYVPMLRDFWRDGLFEAPARRYFRLMDRFSDTEALLSADLALDRERTFREFEDVFNSHGAAAMINRIMCFDLKTHLQALLHVEDRTSMAWGLESRVPLLDHRLIELLASVPPVIKFKNGRLKYLFRNAVSSIVPRQIRERRDKMGFPVPLAKWSAGPLRPFIRETLLSKRCRERGLFEPGALSELIEAEKPFSRALWGALCLELWHRRFIDAGAEIPEPAADVVAAAG